MRTPAHRRTGYGDLKKTLFEHYWNHFAAARAAAPSSSPTAITSTRCCATAPNVPRVASKVLERARVACGWGIESRCGPMPDARSGATFYAA